MIQSILILHINKKKGTCAIVLFVDTDASITDLFCLIRNESVWNIFVELVKNTELQGIVETRSCGGDIHVQRELGYSFYSGMDAYN